MLLISPHICISGHYVTSFPTKLRSVAKAPNCCLDTDHSVQHADSDSAFTLLTYLKNTLLFSYIYLYKLGQVVRRHGECSPDKRSGHFVFENAGRPAHQSPVSFIREGESASQR